MYLRLQAELAAHTKGNGNCVEATFDTAGGTFGRDPRCTMVLPDPLRHISRIQGQVVWLDGRFYLINASTSNPIYVNGCELRPGDRAEITGPEEWCTGSFVIKVQSFAEDPAHRAPADSSTMVADPSESTPSAQGHGRQAQEQEQAAASPLAASMNGPFGDLLTDPPPAAPPGASGESLAQLPPDPFAPSLESAQAEHRTAMAGYRNDPFADLLSEPLNAQIASAPARSQALPSAGQLIPADFNPLAASGVSPRNTDDPLDELLATQQIHEMFPERSLDAIFDPAKASIDIMTADPLQVTAHAQFLDAANHVDPLTMFADEHSVNALHPEHLLGTPHVGKRTLADHTPELGSYFRAPQALPDVDFGSAQPPPASFTSPPAALERAIAIDAVFDLGTSATSAGEPGHVPAPSAALLSAPSPVPCPGEDCADPVMPAAQALADGAGTSSDDSTAALLAAFKQGAGLGECHYPGRLTPELMHMVGQMLSISVQGCMDLLGSRAAAKQEVRIAVTLINDEANNPLKFLPTGASALAQIFGPRMPGFMSGPAALQTAHEDLRTHELAMMAGMQATLQGVFERFDPAVIERQLNEQGRQRTLFQAQRQARLWETYCAHYQWVREEMKNQTPASWGNDFHAAYHSESHSTRHPGAHK